MESCLSALDRLEPLDVDRSRIRLKAHPGMGASWAAPSSYATLTITDDQGIGVSKPEVVVKRVRAQDHEIQALLVSMRQTYLGNGGSTTALYDARSIGWSKSLRGLQSKKRKG